MKQTTREKTIHLVIAALFTAFITVMSQIAIPMPSGVPITLQTFAVALCGYVLGIKWGFASITAYVLLGAVGVPVFSGFHGGINNIFGMTGGFIYGFIAFVVICGLSLYVKNMIFKILIGFGGLTVCHIFGVIQFAAVYGTNLKASFLMVSMPYLIKDIVSVVLAYFLSIYLDKLLKKIH